MDKFQTEMLTCFRWAKKENISQLKPNFVSLSPLSNLKLSNSIVTNPFNVFHLYMIECICWSIIGVVVVQFEQTWLSKISECLHSDILYLLNVFLEVHGENLMKC